MSRPPAVPAPVLAARRSPGPPPAADLRTAFGPPAAAYHVGRYTVLVWPHENLLSRLR